MVSRKDLSPALLARYDARIQQGVEASLDHPAFLGALRWATENGFGKASAATIGVAAVNDNRQMQVVIRRE